MIKVFVEQLYHFNCDNCNKWFSVGDWQYEPELKCPFCEVTQPIVDDAQLELFSDSVA